MSTEQSSHQHGPKAMQDLDWRGTPTTQRFVRQGRRSKARKGIVEATLVERRCAPSENAQAWCGHHLTVV